MVIMVMGVQRSGTTVLFKSLAADPSICGYNEEEPDVFHNYFLKPEEKIRKFLQGRTCVLKAISESKTRSLEDVFEEYKDYDLRIAWTYRDPINVYYSAYQFWRTGVDKFIFNWNRRNRVLLDASDLFDKIKIVKYEDMVQDSAVFLKLCKSLNINGKYSFLWNPGERHRKKKERGCAGNLGYKFLTPDIKEKIANETREVWNELEDIRNFIPMKKFI